MRVRCSLHVLQLLDPYTTAMYYICHTDLVIKISTKLDFSTNFITERLGGSSDMVTFRCESNSAAVWTHNGVTLTENDEKYQFDTRALTVRQIVGSDEGNYSCVQSGDVTGCLLVYGKHY